MDQKPFKLFICYVEVWYFEPIKLTVGGEVLYAFFVVMKQMSNDRTGLVYSNDVSNKHPLSFPTSNKTLYVLGLD